MPPLLLLLLATAPDFSGAEACRKCHPRQFAAQSATPHARALARSRPDQPGNWAFGAGSQAITFVSRLDPEHYLEHGESWYRSLNGYALTPGHRSKSGETYRIFDPSAAILRCFACHSTGPLTVSQNDVIVPSELGVRCEACHGPAAKHSTDPLHSHPRNPGRLSADQINHLCGGCHRMPAAAGDDTDLMNPWNARHQPLLLAASRCFRESGGRLTCFTCHAPHDPVDRNQAAYNAACATCHAAVKHKRTVTRACVECHMPTVRPQPNLSFANHRIGIYATGVQR